MTQHSGYVRTKFARLILVVGISAVAVGCGSNTSTGLATSASSDGPPPGASDPTPTPAPPAPLGQRKVSKEQAIAAVVAVQSPGSSNTYQAKDVQIGDLFADREHDADKATIVRRVPQQPATAVLVRGKITPPYDVTGKLQFAWAVYAVDGETGEVLATWGSPTASDAAWFDKLVERG